MSSILRAAYLKVCTCEQHASIVIDDDDLSGPFITKTGGVCAAETLKKSGEISAEECELICEAIGDSPLPHHVVTVVADLEPAHVHHGRGSPAAPAERTIH